MWRPIAFAGVLGLFALQMGCVAYATTEPAVVAEPQAAVVVDYRPLYYQGHVVLYDDVTYRPYYVVSGRPYYVPRTYAHYNTLVRHYHRSPAAYHRWHSHHPQYRHYRMHGPRHPVHRGPPVHHRPPARHRPPAHHHHR
jgi:hypothetical protein